MYIYIYAHTIYIYTSKYYVNTCIYICMNLSISCVPICIPNIPNYIPCFIVFGSYRILVVVYHYIVKIPPILVYYIIIYIQIPSIPYNVTEPSIVVAIYIYPHSSYQCRSCIPNVPSYVPIIVVLVCLHILSTHIPNDHQSLDHYMALSKHMVPLNPLVNDDFPHDMAMVGLYPIFRQTDYHIRSCLVMAHYISPRYVPMILYVHCYIITIYIYTYPQIVFFFKFH